MSSSAFNEWCRRWNVPPAAVTELANLQPDVGPGETESTTLQRIRLDASAAGVTLWRNNSGVMFPRDGSRPVRYGLGNESAAFNRVMKSSDLVGIGPGGRFAAVEVKRPGWVWKGSERELAQHNFHICVRERGGLACFATSWADVRKGFGL